MGLKQSSKKLIAFVCALSLMATQLVAMPSTVTNKVLNNVSVSATTTDQTDSSSRITRVAGTKVNNISVTQGADGWTNNGNNGFYSTKSAHYDNKEDSYMANTDQYMTITFTSQEDFRLSYDYKVSSEAGCDYLSVALNKGELTNQLTKESGVKSGSYNGEFTAGTYTLKLLYHKDVSYSRNEDRAWVSNIKISPAISEPTLSDEGYYEITSKQELLWFAEEVNKGNSSINAKLMNDIDYDDIQTKIGTSTTSSYYNGTFDGNGHTVKVNFNSSNSYTALFSYANTSATIKNLIVDGTIRATGSYAGGIVGYSNNATVENCAFIGNMSASNYAGGIMGSAESYTTIKNCYVTGDMTNCTNSYAITYSTLTNMSNCYYLNTIGASSNGATSMDISQFNSGEVAFKLSHSDALISDDNIDGFIEGSPWGQNIGTENYPTLNGNRVYATGIYDPCTDTLPSRYNGGYNNSDKQVQYTHYYDENGFDTTTNPEDNTISFNHKVTDIELYEPAILNEKGYYEISNMGQLYWFAKQINDLEIDATSNAILTSDINVEIPEITDADGNQIPTWTPIATTENVQYRGTFDGNGHVISGLTCINSEENPFEVGFISEIANGAKVLNLGIENSTFEDTVGGILVGSISGNNLGTIANCYSTATVIGKETSVSGGISGAALSKNSKFLNVYFGGHVNSNAPIIDNGFNTKIISPTDNVYCLSTSFDGDLDTIHNKYAQIVYATKNDVPENVTDAIVVSSGQLTYLLERNSSDELLNFDALGYVPFVQDLPDTLEEITGETSEVTDVAPRFAQNGDDATTNLVYKSYLTNTCNHFITPSECTTIYTNTKGDEIFGIHDHNDNNIKECEKPAEWFNGMVVNQVVNQQIILDGTGDIKISQTDFNALKPNTVADCETELVQWYQCADCGAYFYVVGSKDSNKHNFDYNSDGKTDWNDILYIAEHNKDDFTNIVHISYLPTCIDEFGSAHIHVCNNNNEHSVSSNEIEFTIEDYYKLRCILGGEDFKKTNPTLSDYLDSEEARSILHHGHWRKVYYPNGTVLHVNTCCRCGEVLSSHIEDVEYSYTNKNHTVVNSNCKDTNCDFASDTYTEEHHFNRYSPITKLDGTIDATKHHSTCFDCGAVVAEPHEFDENGVCVCGYDITTDQEKANASIKINLVPDYDYYYDKFETIDDINKVRFILSVDDVDSGDNYSIARTGVVYTKNLDNNTVHDEDLIIEKINGTTIKGAYSEHSTGFYMNITPATENDIIAVKAYAIVYDEKTGNSFTVYSDIKTDTLEDFKNNVNEISDQKNLEKALRNTASVSVEMQKISGYELEQKAKFVVTRTITNPEDTKYKCVRYGFVYSKNFGSDITKEEAESQLVVENIDGTNIKGAYSNSTSTPSSINASITNNGKDKLTLFRPYYVVVDEDGNEYTFYDEIVVNFVVVDTSESEADFSFGDLF